MNTLTKSKSEQTLHLNICRWFTSSMSMNLVNTSIYWLIDWYILRFGVTTSCQAKTKRKGGTNICTNELFLVHHQFCFVIAVAFNVYYLQIMMLFHYHLFLCLPASSNLEKHMYDLPPLILSNTSTMFWGFRVPFNTVVISLLHYACWCLFYQPVYRLPVS